MRRVAKALLGAGIDPCAVDAAEAVEGTCSRTGPMR
jgi:hypothetical protein